MLSEFEAVYELHKLIFTLIIISVPLLEFFYYFNFHICIIYVEFLVFADLGRYYSLVWVLFIYAFDDLAEGSIINNSYNLIPIGQLLSLNCHILPILISNLKLVVSSDFADCIDSFI